MSKQYFTDDVTNFSNSYSTQKKRTIKISGGKSLTLSKSSSSWYNNLTSLTDVKIGNEISSLGYGCFYYCSNLSSIALPDTVTSLGNYCFYYCSNLSSIALPDSVTSLGKCCFSSCSNLSSITLPNSVTSLGDECFSSCSNLSSITLPNSVTSLGDECFSSCSNLSSITLPSSLTYIHNRCFYNCRNLSSISSLNIIAPTAQDDAFLNTGYATRSIGNNLYIPYGASGYDKSYWKSHLIDRYNFKLNQCFYDAQYLSVQDQARTGSEIKPTLYHGISALTENVDYTAIYENNIEDGTATMKVTLLHECLSSNYRELNFEIIDLQNDNRSLIMNYKNTTVAGIYSANRLFDSYDVSVDWGD